MSNTSFWSALAVGALVSAVGCASTPSGTEVGADLKTIQERITAIATETDGPGGSQSQAIVAAVQQYSDELVDLAQQCETVEFGGSNVLRAQCQAIATQAYVLLAELPTRPDKLAKDPEMLASDVLRQARETCAPLRDNAHCHAMDGWRGLLASGQASIGLRNRAMETGRVETDVVLRGITNFRESAVKDWPALVEGDSAVEIESGAIEQRRQHMQRQTCDLMWSIRELQRPERMTETFESPPYLTPMRDTLLAAANSAKVPAADPAVCTADPDGEGCRMSRYDAIYAICNPLALRTS